MYFSECARCGYSEHTSTAWGTWFDPPWDDDAPRELICPGCTDELRAWWEQ